MLEFAELLTRDPASIKKEYVQGLRDVGWKDEDVIDIVHITAWSNYLDRVADGLGIELEPLWGELSERLSFKGKTAPKSLGSISKVPAPGNAGR